MHWVDDYMFKVRYLDGARRALSGTVLFGSLY